MADHLAVEVRGLPAVAEIAGGWGSSCIRSKKGQVWCWGSNINGEVGVDEGDHILRPVQVKVPRASELHAGIQHFCAVSTSERRVWCWGSHHINDKPDPAERNVNPPRLMNGSRPLPAGARLRLTRRGACIIGQDHRARCWGAFGGPPEGHPLTSQNPLTYSGVRDVVSGNEFTCVLTTDREVLCYSAHQALSGVDPDGEVFDIKWRPVSLPFKVERLHGKAEGACALGQRGRVACWGALPATFGAPVPGNADSARPIGKPVELVWPTMP